MSQNKESVPSYRGSKSRILRTPPKAEVLKGRPDSHRELPLSYEPKILVFACNWCSYAGADLAGVSRLEMPPNCRLIRVMCSARVRPEFVISALCRGMDGVVILGCHPGECHYSEGNYYTRRRGLILKKFLEYVGIEPERFQIRWVSASEGVKFANVVKETVEKIKSLGQKIPPLAGLQYGD